MDRQHYLHWTYRQIRLLAGSSLIVVPVAIILLGWFQYGHILPTLSHYYFGEPRPGVLRTLFTGLLILVGGIMIAYRGFDDKDNVIHNLAGCFAICVAFFPKKCDELAHGCVETNLSLLHMPSAVALFLMAGWAVWYSGGEKLSTRLNDDERKTLRRVKVIALIGMCSGLLAYLPYFLGGDHLLLPTVVLIVELTGFFGFALYWLVLTYVIYKANKRLAGVKAKSDGAQGPRRSAGPGLAAAPQDAASQMQLIP